MKKIFTLSFLMFCCFISSTFGAYEYSGFNETKSDFDSNVYVCEEFCLIKFSQLEDIDDFMIQGNFTGNGQIGLGVTISGQVQGVYNFQITGDEKIDELLSLDQLKKQLPSSTQVYVYYQGNIHSEVSYILRKYSFSQMLKKQVFSPETFAPYSINLRYGKSFNGISIIQIFYTLFIIIICILVFFIKLRRYHIFLVALGLYSIIACINLWSFHSLYSETKEGYKQKGAYHNMGDYFSFVDGARKEIGLDNFDDSSKYCTYNIQCQNDWPFCYYLKSLYFQPCTYIESPEDAQYIILHKTEVSPDMQKRDIIFSRGGSYLLK